MSPITYQIAALLQSAHRAGVAGRTLRHAMGGFRDIKRTLGPIHAFATCRAAERRGLVLITGAKHKRQLLITASGLDAMAAYKKDMPPWPKVFTRKTTAAPAAAPTAAPASIPSRDHAGGSNPISAATAS